MPERASPVRAAALAFALCAAAAACAHYPETAPLTVTPSAAAGPASPARYVFDQLPASDADDDLFVCLTFSGGGTRAAAFSFGVLQKLRDTAVVRPADGRHESLLDDVDCISSVSGGSFTAAYYALFGARIFQDYRQTFLERNVESELIWKTVNPFNWPRLLSPYFSRIDLATELYDRTIFGGKRYADLLAAPRRPFIILNGTDMTTGDGFEFTQDVFDLIGSDLGPFSVARAVAASSAFPFLLTPISLTNHPQPAGYVPPRWLANGARDYYVNRRRYVLATNRAAYLDKQGNPYIHVMDGGLADNIGMRALERAVSDPTGFIAQRLSRRKISRLVVIGVNAHNSDPQTLNQHESPPGLEDVALKTATVAMDNFSFETIQFLRERQRELRQAQQELARCRQIAREQSDCPSLAPFEIHVVDIGLEAIADPARRRRLLSIGTNYSLSHDDVQGLIDAAAELLDANPDFQRVLASLRAATPPSVRPVPPAAATPAPPPAPPTLPAPAAP